MMKKNNPRRAFINEGLKSISRFFVDNEIPEELIQKPEKVKMLTPDGKLVEVDANAIKKKSKTTNKDILQWMSQNKPDPSNQK